MAVSVSELCKRYGGVEAVRGVSFEVASGTIFGLLGPNGAGKTTTLECLLGLRQPDSGVVRINGFDMRSHSRQARRFMGAQLQAASLQDQITPREALELFGSFYADPFEANELLRRFDLEPKADAPFSTLSGGQRQRMFLALALVNRPTLLVLDEPTAGLDPNARRQLRELIREQRGEGRTVLLSTHDLEEARELCDQVAIMDRGRIVTIASPAELIARAKARSRVVVRTDPPLSSAAIRSLAADAVPCDGGWAIDTAEPSRLLAQVARTTDEAHAQLLEVELRRPSLEDAFVELTGRTWPSDDAGAPR